jgi:hypothetical protein
MSRGRRIASGGMLACLLASSLAGNAIAASTKWATATTTFVVGADGRCYALSTASWSGYQVNRVRHVFYRAGHVDQDYAWFSTTVLPNGTSKNSGSMTSVSGIAAVPGEGWYTHSLFRSNGGAILVEGTSAVAYAPPDCPAP